MIKGRGVNPADAFRKQEKKKEAKKAKQQRDELREVRGMLNDPTKIDAEIEKFQKLSKENRLDKGLKNKIAELNRMRDVAVGKQKVDAAMGRKPQSTASPSSSSIVSNATANARVFQPQDSVYYHPVYNPFANPPLGQPQMWKRDAPPPPPPSAARMAMGGMHGIPLPPPRGLPPPPPPLPQQEAPAASRVNKRRIVEVTFDDPLDPAVSGYEKQFGRKYKRAFSANAKDGYEKDDHYLPTQQQQQQQQIQIANSTTQLPLEVYHRAVEEEYEDVGPSLPEGGTFPPLRGFAPMTGYNHDDNEVQHNKTNKKKTKEKVDDQLKIMLPGLEDYGDDDEEQEDDSDEDNDDVEEGDGDNEQNVGPSMPMDYNEYAAAFYQSDAFPPFPELHHPTQAALAVEEAEAAVPVVKVAKVDQALTAFVPAVLKNKKPPKAPAFIPRPPPSKPPVVAAANPQEPVVDDEYDLFMQEISGL